MSNKKSYLFDQTVSVVGPNRFPTENTSSKHGDAGCPADFTIFVCHVSFPSRKPPNRTPCCPDSSLRLARVHTAQSICDNVSTNSRTANTTTKDAKAKTRSERDGNEGKKGVELRREFALASRDFPLAMEAGNGVGGFGHGGSQGEDRVLGQLGPGQSNRVCPLSTSFTDCNV